MTAARLARRSAALAAALALIATAAQADHPKRGWKESRALYATTDQNQLIKLNARNPERIKDVRSISGLPSGVTLRGIDFRPATGDLYGVGSDSVVYRLNPRTGIAVAEGPAFTPALRGAKFGIDFNPVVDKIRVVSDAAQNLRLNVDEGTLLSADRDLNPGMPQVVGAGYENSSFSATRPAATVLRVVDAASDQVFRQDPPNDGTLTGGQPLDVDVKPDANFDVAGADNTGYLTNPLSRRRGTGLYMVDVQTGDTRLLGRIGIGRRAVITGLAAWQD